MAEKKAEKKQKQYVCECGQTYTSPDGLQYHLKTTGHNKLNARIVLTGTGEVFPFKHGPPAAASKTTLPGIGTVPVKEVNVVTEVAEVREESKGDGKETKKVVKPPVSPFLVSLYRMVPMQATIFHTPVIWSSFACAIARGYKGDFQDFLGLAVLDFWLGRNINPFEELALVFENVPSTLPDRLVSTLEEGSNEQKGPGVAGDTPKEGTE